MKRPAGKSAVMKHAIMKNKKKKVMKKRGAGKDARSGGRWLWAAVSVGHGSVRYTHGNGQERLTCKMLPHKTQAEDGKPRGEKELRKVFAECIRKGSKLVFGGWRASQSAAKSLGLQYAKPVVHDICWRDASTTSRVSSTV
jgi:hypothetical protein